MAEEGGGDVEATAGSRVGDDSSEGVLVGGGGEVFAVQIERRGAPDVAPPGREDPGALAVLPHRFFHGWTGPHSAAAGQPRFAQPALTYPS